jgi:hypothetical protein
MNRELRKRLQILLIIFFLVAVVRIAMIYRGRHEGGETRKQPQLSSNYKITDDDYVTPPRIFPYDAKSAAKELAGKTVWVRTGNQLIYYCCAAPYTRQAGLLGPLQKLAIKTVALEPPTPGSNQKRLVAVFNLEGDQKPYGVVIGTEDGGTYNFYINDALFLADPHGLYPHWPAETWNAIDHHQVIKGMNELQVGFAIGTGANVGSGEIGNRTNEYTNGGKPVKVTFENNKVTEIVPAQ